MKRLFKTLGLLVTLSAFAFSQQSGREGLSSNFLVANAVASILLAHATAQDQQPETKRDEKHLSKKEKKELKKRRKEEEKRRKEEARKDEKRRKEEAKKQEEQVRDQQKREAREQAKNSKRELKKQNKEIARVQKQQDEREGKAEAKEIKSEETHERRSDQRAVAAITGGERYSIPVSYRATPALLQAQQKVARSIYSQMPNSHVIVLVNPANQLVLRGSAPTPSLKRRLLGLAMSAAGGYGVVDQLASNFVGSAAGGVTSAAIGGVSDLIRGSGSHQDNRGAYDQQEPPPDNVSSAYGPPSNGPPDGNYGPPADAGSYALSVDNGSNGGSNSGLLTGSNACVSVSNAQASLTGEAESQLDRERLERFAQQLAGTNATVVDQLATRANRGYDNAGNPQDLPPEAILDGTDLTGLVSQGSVVCVNTANNALMLSGTVASSAELASVERRLQPLFGDAPLVDQLTTGALANSRRPEPTPPATATNSAGAVGSEVEQALHSIPRLSTVDAEVGTTTVRLSGSVETPQDEQVAREIAQQYAPGRSVIDALIVTGRDQAVQ